MWCVYMHVQVPIRARNSLGGTPVTFNLNVVVPYEDLFLYYFGMYLLTGFLSWVLACMVYFTRSLLTGPLIRYVCVCVCVCVCM
jgi:hypothetical protein